MKIKILATFTFMFFAYMGPVYSQLDTSSQLEILQKLQQEETGIDDSIDSFENKELLDKADIADDREIKVICRLDTLVEIEFYKNGGILHTVFRNYLRENLKK